MSPSIVDLIYSLQVFTNAKEEALSRYLITSSKMIYGLPRSDTWRFAYEHAEGNGRTCPSPWPDNQMA